MQIKALEDRCNYQEDYSRRNNLRVSGVAERPGGETWEQTAVLVKSLFLQQLQLSDVTIERAHRTGKPSPQGHRTIVVRFATFTDRELVMRNTNKLSGTKIYINEDLCPASQTILRSQLPQLKKARSEGKVAFFRHTTLVIKEKTTTNAAPPSNNVPTTVGVIAPSTTFTTAAIVTTCPTHVSSTNSTTIVSTAPTTTINSIATVVSVPPPPLQEVSRNSSTTTNTDLQLGPATPTHATTPTHTATPTRTATPIHTASMSHDSQGLKQVQCVNKKSDSATPKGHGTIKKNLRKKN